MALMSPSGWTRRFIAPKADTILPYLDTHEAFVKQADHTMIMMGLHEVIYHYPTLDKVAQEFGPALRTRYLSWFQDLTFWPNRRLKWPRSTFTLSISCTPNNWLNPRTPRQFQPSMGFGCLTCLIPMACIPPHMPFIPPIDIYGNCTGQTNKA